MIWYKGSMWDYPADLYVATGNSVVKRDGRLVMGAGVAKQMLDRYPECDLLFGEHIKQMPSYPFYGFVFIPKLNIGLLQTKYHYKNPSSVNLIESSLSHLARFAHGFVGTIVMPVPGVGNGWLSFESVAPLLGVLPDNIIVAH